MNNSAYPFIYPDLYMELAQKTILLTGASSGIGAELARQLAERDCRLVLVARRHALLADLSASLRGGTAKHSFYTCDLANPDAVMQLCETIHLHVPVLDGMILNAGVGGDYNPASMDMADIRHQFEVNFWSVVEIMARFLPALIEKRAGFVAVTSSLAGYRGMPGSAPYSAAKSALNRFIESTRIDCQGLGIHFAVISPGFVRTPMTANSRVARPFIISAQKAARIIIHGLLKEKYEIRFPWQMVLLARIGLLLPERLYIRLMHGRRKSGQNATNTDLPKT